LRRDRDIVKASSGNSGDFRYVITELQIDKEIVSLFVLNDNIKLGQISEKLQNDPFNHLLLMDINIENCVGFGSFSAGQIEQDASRFNISENYKDFIIAMAANQNYHLYDFKKIYRDDKDVVLAYVTSWGFDLKFVSERLRDCDEVVLASVFSNHDTLQYASARIRDNKEIVSRFVEINSDNFKHASD
jgi:hypothetical protein